MRQTLLSSLRLCGAPLVRKHLFVVPVTWRNYVVPQPIKQTQLSQRTPPTKQTPSVTAPSLAIQRNMGVPPAMGAASKPLPGVMGRVKPMGFAHNKGIKILMYGESGSGKTTLWSTFPGPILAMICSGGKDPGELLSIDTPSMREKVQTVVLEKCSEMDEIVNYYSSPETQWTIGTIVLDHVTGFQDLKTKEVLRVDNLSVQRKWGDIKQQDYGVIAGECKDHFHKLLSLPCNVVIVGQERVFNSKDDGNTSDVISPKVGCALIPSLAGWLNPACDYVIQMFKRPRMEATDRVIGGKTITTVSRGKGVEYCARTEAHDVFMTKFRMPRERGDIPECIVDPSYDKIIQLIRG